MNNEKFVTLITGTSKGIGKALAHYYLDKGHIVCGFSRSDADISHSDYEHFNLSVSDEKAVVQAMANIRKKHGHIHHLINNAGIASMNHSLMTPLSTAEKIFSTNFYGTFLFSREAAKLMMKQKYGRICNFSTVASPLNLEGEAIYAASKSAVETLTRVLAKEFSQLGITVNCIGPTPVETDLIKNVPKDKIKNLIDSQAIKRFGAITDLTNVIDFYLRKESEFITGQTIYLGGVF